MNDLIVTRKEYCDNPAKVGEVLRETAIALSVNKARIEEIKTRNPIKGLFSYKALAEAMLEQNQSISAFMEILQSVLLLQANNVGALTVMMESLNRAEQTDAENENEYISIAKECLQEALVTAEKNCEQERKINSMQRELDLAAEQMQVVRKLAESLERQAKRQEKRFKILLGVCIGMSLLCVGATVLAFLI